MLLADITATTKAAPTHMVKQMETIKMISTALHRPKQLCARLLAKWPNRTPTAGRKSKSTLTTWLKKKATNAFTGAPALHNARKESNEKHSNGVIGQMM